MNSSRLIALLLVCQLCVWVGCGSGSNVIQPGEPYQLTADELALTEQAETLREAPDESIRPVKRNGFSR